MRYYKPLLAFLIITAGVCLLFCSCKKLLQESPSTELQPPHTLEDLIPLFNDQETMNYSPGLNDLSADNIYLLHEFWLQRSATQQNAYLWKPDIYGADTAAGDYDLCSAQVLYTNIVLENLEKIPKSSNSSLWNKLKGMALFFRSWAVFNMAQLYAPSYDASTAYHDLGVPLRHSSSTGEKTVRSTVKQTYDQIIQDLQTSIPLLTPFDASNNNLPSQPAAYGMLARVYQSMNLYEPAKQYADSCLKLYNQLLDYKTLNFADNKPPFGKTNPEIIFKSNVSDKTDALQESTTSGCIVDSVLYRSFVPDDLRVHAFFMLNTNGQPVTKKSYDGMYFPFSGLATDELYLIRAESRARTGDRAGALNDLNTLLKTRWAAGTFVDFTASSDSAALHIILEERRKELPLRGLRWTDLRRLNKLGYNIELTRKMDNTTYTLLPNDKLYVLPFPPDVISLTGMPQNQR